MAGFRQIPIKCTVCEKETALVGEGIDKKYTVEFFESQGWKFSKYKTMCPDCKKKEKEEWNQLAIDIKESGGENNESTV